MGIDGRLFQAAMWRRYAMMWDGQKPPGVNYPAWFGLVYLETVLKISRGECLRRARINIYLARRLNRTQGSK